MNRYYCWMLLILLVQVYPGTISAQTAQDTIARQHSGSAAKDPSQFFTRRV
jgi:hypothetical protein